MNCRETYRKLLLCHYFSTPLDVSIHLFACIGNGFEWKNGNLVNICPDRTCEPTELRKYEAGSSVMLNARRSLEYEAKKIKREFVEQNIETILDAGSTASFFKGETRHGHYDTLGICTDYAKAFHWPEDIQKDWAKALLEFLDWWKNNLRRAHGVIESKDLPKQEKIAWDHMHDSYVRLYPYVHGVDYSVAMELQAKIADDILNRILEEEKNEGRRQDKS